VALCGLTACTPAAPDGSSRAAATSSPSSTTTAAEVDQFPSDDPARGTESAGCQPATADAATRFGDFLVSGIHPDDRAGTPISTLAGPLFFTPRTPGKPGQMMVVRAVNSGTGATFATHTDAVSSSGAGGRSFYVLGVDLPSPGRWELHLTLGSNAGCAVVVVE